MGIKDLLRFMKPYIEHVHIKKYAGKRVGIDAYSWLHKGAYSCSMELCLDEEGRKKLQYIDYFMHRINLLRHNKITPVVVFDGGNIPCKASIEDERHRRRKANRELALERLNEGNIRAATELFQRAISVTPAMAHQLIQILKSENVEFVVAPYEADSQLAYLASLEVERDGISAVISEDSDLLAYGCKAVLFKMDRYGNGEELLIENVFNSESQKPSFQNFDLKLFAGMCVLAGCDFLPSITGIGIVKAHSFVSKYRNLDRVLSVLKIEKGNQMPEDYWKSFKEAVAVFQHARVYDSQTKKLKLMTPLPETLVEFLDGELDFLGPELPASVATAIAEGNLDPTNMEAFKSSSSSDCRLNIDVKTSSRFLEPANLSVQESSFLVTSSHSYRESADFGMLPPSKATGGFKRSLGQDMMKRKNLKEDSELHKLLFQPNDRLTIAGQGLSTFIPMKVPDNNPFKRNKLEEIPLEQIKTTEEELQVWFETEDEKSKTIFLDSESSGNVSLQNRQESMVQLDRTGRSGDEHVVCGNVKSQKSVRKKTKKVSRSIVRGKNERLKTNSCKSEENEKSSILNFFRPV